MKIRDILDILKQDGWLIVKMKGSHRVLKHSEKPGIVVFAGKLGNDIAHGTLKSILIKQDLRT